LNAVVGLAAELGDTLVVVFASEVSRLGGEVHDYEEALRERGRALLEEARAVAGEAGVESELVMRELASAEALIAVADEHDARLIAVGSYGERPLKSALVGSTPTHPEPGNHVSTQACVAPSAARSPREWKR